MNSDKKIQEDVMRELDWDPEVDSEAIGVAVEDGVVTLSGQVDSYWTKKAAERATKGVKGVKGIAQEIHVRYPGMDRTDTDIAEAAVRALKWNTTIPGEAVKVKVEHGWVILDGEVHWNFQKKAAEHAVEKIKGVLGVSNLIVVKPRVQASIVKDTVRRALERRADVEADDIEVETRDSKVILRGKVKSWSERAEVQRAAWSAPGVTNVENNLTIG